MLKEKVMLLTQTKKFKRYRDEDIAKLLKLIVLDGETDLKKLTSNLVIPQKLVEKYLSSKEIMMEYLTEEEYNEFLFYYNKLTNFIEKVKVQEANKSKKDEAELLKSLIADIMETRLSKQEILVRNKISNTPADRLINNEELLDKIYGPGFMQILKNRIKQRSIERESVPRNMYIVEEREDLKVVKDNIIYLNEFDFKRMKIISSYVNNDFDIDLVSKEKELSHIAIIKVLLLEKNKEILKPYVYEVVQKMAKLDKLLLTGMSVEKQEIVYSVIMCLEQNNYDINLVSQELQLPIAIIKTCLKQSFITIFYSSEQVRKINDLLVSEETKKIKGM